MPDSATSGTAPESKPPAAALPLTDHLTDPLAVHASTADARSPGALTIPTDLRRALRARAHDLSPVVLVGAAGVSDAVINEIDRALTAHELVKVRLAGLDRNDQTVEAARICDRLAAANVQKIGHVLVIWRPRPEDND